MQPEKEVTQCYEQMNIVEKYETVIAYLYHSTGWRETLAAWFCFNLLNAFDPSGKNC